MITYLWAPPGRAKGGGNFGPLLDEGVRDGRVAIASYPEAFAGRAIAAGPVVFSDVPRLWGPPLVESARLWQRVVTAGGHPLNHPVRGLRRFALLRRLKAEGLNSFDIWRGDERREPCAIRCSCAASTIATAPMADLSTIDISSTTPSKPGWGVVAIRSIC